jgi:CheY-like chemotaxis protein
MNGKFALIVHRDPQISRRISQALAGAGLKVMAAATDEEALGRLGTFFVPDVLLTSLDAADPAGSPTLSLLRANPLTQHVPTVILASGAPDERRRCLRLGITLIVEPPHEDEDVLLNTRLALERHRDERLLSGSLEQLSVPDLLQTLETTRRGGLVTLKSAGRVGTLWLKGGRVIDAEINDGRRGKEAVLAIALWQQGTFEADFNPVSVPERISESTSYLLLEAMRLKDESSRDEDSLPSAALPDPPPQPARPLLAVHRALTLLNVAASYAENHIEPALLEQRLERFRQALLAEHPLLDHFTVGPGGRTAWTAGEISERDVESLVEAVGRWLRDFFQHMEHALPQRFSIRKLRTLTEAVQDDMEVLGFYGALGLDSTAREDTP